MKNLYLVKKDPMQPADCNNWIIMNAYEFAQFIKTPDGQRRKDDFGRLSACSENEYTIYAECGYESAKKWKADQNRQDYVKRVKEEMGISFFSYNSVMVDEDEISGESLIADEDCDVELYVIAKIEKENLHKAIELLPEYDRRLITCLFLLEKPMTEKEFSEKYGIKRRTVNDHKEKALRKLKKIIESLK